MGKRSERSIMSDQYSVLIADDSAFVRKVVSSHLSGTEFSVVAEAGDGVEALELFRTHNPDMVLLDVIMPDKTGPEALEAMVIERPGVKVLVLSSMGSEEVVNGCLAAGAKSFLQKPFEKETLLAQMRDIVGST